MASLEKPHSPIENSTRSITATHGTASLIKSEFLVLIRKGERLVVDGGVVRLSAKFVAIARREGLSVALARCNP